MMSRANDPLPETAVDEGYLAKSLEELAKKQEPLGGEFEKVLHDNLCDLYEK